MTILVIRITMNLGSLFRWAFSSACLPSDRSHSSTPRMYCVGYKGPDVLTFPFLSLSLFNYFSCPFIKAGIFSLRLHGDTSGEGERGGRFLFWNILISSSLPWKPFCCQSSRAVVAFSTTTDTSHTEHKTAGACVGIWVCVCVCVSVQYRHLCVLRPLSASLSQYRTLWCALISWYTLRTIVPFCCELIHVPLTMLSSHFNTPNSAENWKQF